LKLLIIVFLILQPFLDIIAGANFPFGIHLFIRGLFLIFLIFSIFNIKKRDKVTILMTLIMFIYFCSYLILYHYSFMEAVSYTFKLFYLPIVIIFFYYYSDKIDRRYLIITLLLYLGIFILCYIFGLGDVVYEEEVKKVGFKGLFNSINEFSAIIITLFPMALDYLLEKKKYIYCVLFIFLILIISFLIGTKVILGGFLITLLFTFYKPIIKVFKRQSVIKRIVIVMCGIFFMGGGIFLVKNSTAYKNAMVQAKFFNIKNVLSLEGINKVVFNDRFSFIPECQDSYNKASLYEKLLGLEYNDDRKDVEIDFFDIFYKYGIVGLIVISFILIYYGCLSKLRGVYLFSFCLLLLISETSGHVLIYPSVCLYFGVIIYFNKFLQKKKDN